MSSKSKGSAWERDVCKFLSVWLTGKEKPYQYWRMPASGGLATISEENADLSGDIRALTPEGEEALTQFYSIECKTGYPHTSFWQHFKDIKGFNIEMFWRQCIGDAKKANKLPMLIYRKKGNNPIIGLNHYWKGLDLPSIRLTFKKEKGLPPLVFYNMKEFFNIVTPKEMKEKYGNMLG